MKIKRGAPFLYEGKPVWIERDKEDGTVIVCYAQSRAITDTFECVLVSNLTEIKKSIVGLKNTKSKVVDKINNKSDLDKWYESQDVPERCENCNQKLNAFNKWAKRCVTAHIVPKSLFPEVATHPANRAFMGVALFSDCSCHNTFDHLDADTRKQMPIYQKIVERVKEFIHLIPENKLPKLEKYLGLND